MTTIADAEQHERAKQTVERFVQRFDESYRLLAYHAALPLVLTPELLNYLRNDFLRDKNVPWVAEVDLLLSDLCSQVGYELYAMDTHVRAYLLEQMAQDEAFGERRMQEVAQVLIRYVEQLRQIHPNRRQQELQAQRWAAMMYLGDAQCKQAAQEIAKSFAESGSRAEWARLARLTEELSPQLQQEQSLLEYARLVQRIIRTPELVSSAELNRSYQVGDVPLKFPDKLLPGKLKKSKGFPPLQTFNFEVATIEPKQTGRIRKKTELIINRHQQQAQYFSEDLGNDITLEMVTIPGGTFLMGSLDTEEGHQKSESPQHQVSVKSFFMGKYAVTQAQWQAVAALPQVNSELKPEPSYFKGANRPVEQVSWRNAVEFCARLSKQTGRPYRLPSEAEWEYACRANTTTPFHFGETITTDLANYRGTDDKDLKWSGSYGQGLKGIYRRETTPVGSFGVANDFGLYDMHGNVWEWCVDSWHSNYEGAPIDGSVWEKENDDGSENDNDSRMLCGGSWYNYPEICRSAFRNVYYPGDRNDDFGFRLVYPVEWTS